jgi:D-amino-acid dehydrogenase
MKITILGAGVIGITSAYMLARDGHKVEIIDRNSGPSEECSFSNGAQLSYCHAEPWASFGSLKKGLRWIGQAEAPLLFRPLPSLQMWSWVFEYLKNCNSKAERRNTERILKLGLLSRKVLHEIENDLGFDFSYRKGGKLFIFRDKEEFECYLKQARLQEIYGSKYQILSPVEALEYEPSLRESVGSIYACVRDPMDESADAYEFSVKLVEKLKEMGVKFHFDQKIEKIDTSEGKISRVITDKNEFQSDLFVLSLGAYSSLLAKEIGIKLPIYPIKGYSITVDIKNEEKAPGNSVTDYYEKVVYSRIGNKLRAAGTAEFAGYDDSITGRRINMLKRSTKKYFPYSGDIDNAESWACLRPSTPDSCPVIGKSDRFKNLYFNTGHGTLGWTQNFASAKIITDIIAERLGDYDSEEFDLNWFSASRFN